MINKQTLIIVLIISLVSFKLHSQEYLIRSISENTEKQVRTLAFHPNGKILAAGYYGGKLKLWNPQSGELIRNLTGHRIDVQSIAFSPNGKILASGSMDETINLWNVNSGEIKNTLFGYSYWVTSVDFSPNGQWLASGGWSGGDTPKLWDVNNGNQLQNLSSDSYKFYKNVRFSSDGKMIALCGNYDIVIKNTVNFKTIKTLKTYSEYPSTFCFSPNSKLLVVGYNFDKRIEVWDVNSEKIIRTLSVDDRWISAIIFSPDGKILASTGDSGKIKLWKISNGKLIRFLKKQSGYKSLAYSPNGEILASGGYKGVIDIWDIKKLQDEIEKAGKELLEMHSIKQLEEYITKHSIKHSDLTNQAISKIYTLTSKIDAIEGYHSFLQKYPKATDAEKATTRLYEIMYAIAEEENNIASYYGFLIEFPKSQKKLREKAFINMQMLEVELAIENFNNEKENDKDNELKERIARQLYVEAIRAKEIGDNYTFMRKYNTVLYSDLFKDTKAAFDLFRDKELARLIRSLRDEIRENTYAINRMTNAITSKLDNIQNSINNLNSTLSSSQNDYTSLLESMRDLQREQASDWSNYVNTGKGPTGWFGSPKSY